jgi:hypothetical protein
MSGTKRTPLHRRSRTLAITEAAIAIFDQMQQFAPCTCTPEARRSCLDDCPGCLAFWRLHRPLRHALGLPLWEYPAIWREPPDRRRSYAPDTPEGRWIALAEASAARRQRTQVTEPEPEPVA